MRRYYKITILKIVFAAGLLFLLPTNCLAQFFSSGQDDGKIKWSEISTPHFNVIFPENCSEIGIMMANRLEKSFAPVAASMKNKPKRISVVMHAESAISNGMVTWAPSKMEIFPFAPQDNYTQPWLDQLAIHEFRHVVQFEYMNQGLTKFFTSIFGESYQLIPIAIYLPYWAMEGDAVFAETQFSPAGRGRLPSFVQEFKALLLETKNIKYDKTMLGSLHSYIPNVYVSGYHVVLANTLTNDSTFCDSALHNLGTDWYNPFSKKITRFRDTKKNRLVFKPAINYLKEVWQLEDSLLTKTESRNLIPKTDDYADYSALQSNDSLLFAIKKCNEDLTTIVSIEKSGAEKKIVTNATIQNGLFDAHKNRLLWLEPRHHWRWEHKSGVDIVQYDITTKTFNRIKSNQRYAALSYSPKGNQFVAVGCNRNNRYSMEIFDANNGAIVKTVITETKYQLINPVWSSDGENIAYILLDSLGKSIRIVNLKNNAQDILLPASRFNLSNLYWHKGAIYFTGTWTGTNNIFRIDVDSKSCYQLTSERFGADFATLKNDTTLIYSAYHSNGNKPVESTASQWLLKPLSKIENYTHLIDRKNNATNAKPIDFYKNPDSLYAIKRYKRIKNSLNFHSVLPWVPLREDYNFQSIQCYSQNVLNNTFITAGIDFDRINYQDKYLLNISYQRWLPNLDFNFTASDYGHFRGSTILSLPFIWRKSSSFIRLIPYGMIYYNREPLNNKNKLLMRSGLQFFQYRYMEAKALSPKYGQMLQVDFTSSLKNSNYNAGSIFYITHRLYLPGILTNHSISIQNTYQRIAPFLNNSLRYQSMQSRVLLPGTTISLDARNVYSLELNYRAPILYPDQNIGSLLYCKRIALEAYYNMFSLWDQFPNSRLLNRYQIVGTRVTALSHLLRYDPEFEIGFHAGWNFSTRQPLSNFVFLFNMPF